MPDTPQKLREKIQELDHLLEQAKRLQGEILEQLDKLHQDDHPVEAAANPKRDAP